MWNKRYNFLITYIFQTVLIFLLCFYQVSLHPQNPQMELSDLIQKYYLNLTDIQKMFYKENPQMIIKKIFFQPNFQSEHLNITNTDNMKLIIE